MQRVIYVCLRDALQSKMPLLIIDFVTLWWPSCGKLQKDQVGISCWLITLMIQGDDLGIIAQEPTVVMTHIGFVVSLHHLLSQVLDCSNDIICEKTLHGVDLHS